MAALCVNPTFHYKNVPFQHPKSRSMNRRHRISVVSSCESNEPAERSNSKTNEKEKRHWVWFFEVLSGVQRFGRGLKENMSPKQKGDWKDVMLMSLSFVVYVYMSQMLVCAYCSWTAMPKPSW
ncbi:hypothetical protein like AT3G52070 [Hibiscus trionum]|uniref:Uncharacterized protein n=1 Tax=Hibiscus trionum TaxID=183268 RepID=A0A9W7LPA2_HIBTR|nr:hypothetical protein like AT3G52070 [Hibiscus trionum]